MIETTHDPMGMAITDYWSTGHASRLRVFSPMFDEDEIPVEHLFRTLESMWALAPGVTRWYFKSEVFQ